MPHILIVEDEEAIAETVLYALKLEGFAARHCVLAREALALLRAGKEPVDLVVLDVGLPDGNGFDLCRELRTFSMLPVIFLTARDNEIDKVVGLEIGADDYLVKPFSPRELVARIRVVLRRAGVSSAVSTISTIPAGISSAPAAAEKEGSPFLLDADGSRIHYRGRPLPLTRYEYLLLKTLIEAAGRILSRAALMERVWHDAPESFDRTVDTHIKTLRAKLRAAALREDASAPWADPIRTHRGLGYSLDFHANPAPEERE